MPIRKPGNQKFIRIHPNPAYREILALLELKADKEIYLVDLAKVPELAFECYLATVYTAMTRSGVLFMWPVKIPAAEGRVLAWHKSAALAAELAMTSWIRVRANMSFGAYEIFESERPIPDPQWPELTYDEIYRIAFKDRLINYFDHPVAKLLR